MKLSAPIFILKQQAKALARRERLARHRALDLLARREGFQNWSQLASAWNARRPHLQLLDALSPGSLVLLAARPGQGKTLLGLQLAAEAARRGEHALFCSLDLSESDVVRHCENLGAHPDRLDGRFVVDTSDAISASYLTKRLASAAPARGTFVVIDYLQALDQNRANPPLAQQLSELKALAARQQLVIVCLGQIDRNYDASTNTLPGWNDVRLPNPVDLGLFDKACFLHQGAMRIVKGPLDLSG